MLQILLQNVCPLAHVAVLRLELTIGHVSLVGVSLEIVATFELNEGGAALELALDPLLSQNLANKLPLVELVKPAIEALDPRGGDGVEAEVPPVLVV